MLAGTPRHAYPFSESSRMFHRAGFAQRAPSAAAGLPPRLIATAGLIDRGDLAAAERKAEQSLESASAASGPHLIVVIRWRGPSSGLPHVVEEDRFRGAMPPAHAIGRSPVGLPTPTLPSMNTSKWSRSRPPASS